MAIIIPAILPTSREDLKDKLGKLVGIATEVQVDIVDGIYAYPASWPYSEGSEEFALERAEGLMLPHLGDFSIEMDLMVRDPEQVTGTWIQAGASRILAHLESTTYLPQLVTDLKVKYGHEKGFLSSLSFGLAVNVATDLAQLEPYLGDLDYVQFMGIRNIGKQGQPFAPEVLEKIATFHAKHPEVPIQVDGGVNFETAPQLLNVGVTRLIVGSALWTAPDLRDAYHTFQTITEENGWYT